MSTSVKKIFLFFITIIFFGAGLWFCFTKDGPQKFDDLQSFVQKDIEGIEIRDFVYRSGAHYIQFIDRKNNEVSPITVSTRGSVSLDFVSATEDKVILAIAKENGCRSGVLVFDRDRRVSDEISLGTCVVHLEQYSIIGFQNNFLNFYELNKLNEPLISAQLNELELLFFDHSAHDVAKSRFAFFAGEDGPAGHIGLYVWNYQEDNLLLIDTGAFILSAETIINFSEESSDELILSNVEIQTIEEFIKIR